MMLTSSLIVIVSYSGITKQLIFSTLSSISSSSTTCISSVSTNSKIPLDITGLEEGDTVIYSIHFFL